jgi:energy-coupling factor transporter ATP-binding protein EcfA2
MILHTLRIENFRGMTNVHFNGLAPLSIVVGSNNAGKSTALEAATLLLRPFDPSQWVQVAKHRDIDMNLVDGLWSLFPTDTPLYLEDGPKQTRPLRVSGRVSNAERELTAEAIASLSWDAESDQEVTLDVRATVKADGHEPKRHKMEFRHRSRAEFGTDVFLFRAFTVTPATHRSTSLLVDHLSNAIDDGQKGLAVDLLKRFDDDVVDLDVSTSRGRYAVRLTHKARGVVDLASFGDGMRRATALALSLARAHGGLLLIDEIETGIHPTILPDILSRLLVAAEEADVQLLATTHSLEAIDALLAATKDRPDSTVAFYVKKTKDGHVVRRYDQPTLVSHREAGLDLR